MLDVLRCTLELEPYGFATGHERLGRIGEPQIAASLSPAVQRDGDHVAVGVDVLGHISALAHQRPGRDGRFKLRTLKYEVAGLPPARPFSGAGNRLDDISLGKTYFQGSVVDLDAFDEGTGQFDNAAVHNPERFVESGVGIGAL